MFTVYIDDSGTAPDQKVVIAAAMIVPATKIVVLDRAWADFDTGYGFNGDFHSSICAARNPHSIFADWSDRKVRNALRRARGIMKRHASKLISMSINKDDFSAEAPAEWLKVGGRDPFTWAFRSLLNRLRAWNSAQKNPLPFQYVIDWVEPKERGEIEMLMAQFESAYPDEYEGRYEFKKRKMVPALQCCDLLAWSAFSASRYAFLNTPMHHFASASFRDLKGNLNGAWYEDLAHTRAMLRKAIKLDQADTAGELRRSVWYAKYVLAQLQAKTAKLPTKKKIK
jgi:hypothetical protein